MSTFTCRARDASGNLVEKTLNADSKSEALNILEESGLSPIEITAIVERRSVVRNAGARPGAKKEANFKLKRKVLRSFTVQLGSSLKAGVPIHAALQAMAEQAEDARYSATLEQLKAYIESGLPLSDGMRSCPRAFPGMYVGTIEAGEKSGTLDDMLDDLAEYLEAEMEMTADVRSAVMYPAIVMGTLCLAMSILVFFVVPRFATFYAGFDADLPLPTRVLIGISEFVQANGALVVGGLFVTATAAVRLARVKGVRNFYDRQLLRIPVIGQMVKTASTLQIAQMLHLFTGAGVPLLEGLETIAATVRSTKSSEDLRLVAGGVQSGSTLAESMAAAGCLPADARQMISTGEKTGSLHQACAVVAGQYKKELRYLTKNVATFIEPVLTLFLAVVVLFVALAAFLPMWDLVRVVRN